MRERDLLVIGGGSGGLVVASVAARLGLDVTLVDDGENLGGDCLHYGCVPSKAMLQAARLCHLMRKSPEFGLAPSGPEAVDLGAVNDRIRERIARIQRHDDPDRFRSYGCEVLFGRAEFIGPREVRIGDQDFRARRIVVATGSSPLIPPIDGLAEAGCITNREVFGLRALPARLAVIGAGPIGMELAQAFARFGSDVAVIQRGPRILPHDDAEASRRLHGLLTHEGMRFLLDAEPTRVAREEDGTKTVVCDAPEGERRLSVDEVLVATGRRPNVDGLNLEAAGIEHDRRGITVDGRQRTTNRRVYACGDVCGPFYFTHMAEYQAGIVLANALFRWPRKADYRVVPWVTYTDPEVAQVGLTETEARERGIPFDTLRFAFDDVDRAIVERENEGFVKLLVQSGPVFRRGRLLGATILGSHAGELLPELALAMQSRRKVGDIAATIHAYPTRAQIHRRAVNDYLGERLFRPWVRRAVGWINRLP